MMFKSRSPNIHVKKRTKIEVVRSWFLSSSKQIALYLFFLALGSFTTYIFFKLNFGKSDLHNYSNYYLTIHEQSDDPFVHLLQEQNRLQQEQICSIKDANLEEKSTDFFLDKTNREAASPAIAMASQEQICHVDRAKDIEQMQILDKTNQDLLMQINHLQTDISSIETENHRLKLDLDNILQRDSSYQEQIAQMYTENQALLSQKESTQIALQETKQDLLSIKRSYASIQDQLIQNSDLLMQWQQLYEKQENQLALVEKEKENLIAQQSVLEKLEENRAGFAPAHINKDVTIEKDRQNEKDHTTFMAHLFDLEQKDHNGAVDQPDKQNDDDQLDHYSRLQSNQVKQSKRKKRDVQRIHIVSNGESLSSIALYYYGDAARWQEIYDANRYLVNNMNQIKVGSALVVP